MTATFQKAQLNETLGKHLHRLDHLEKRLHRKEMTVEEREIIEAELEDVKKLLKINYEALRQLQIHQRSHLPWIFYVCGFLLFCYLMYVMWTNPY